MWGGLKFSLLLLRGGERLTEKVPNFFFNYRWVHSVALNEKGDCAAAVSHGSMITVCSLASGAVKTPWNKFPFKTVAWLSQSRIVCAGFDFIPEVFNVADDLTVAHAGKL